MLGLGKSFEQQEFPSEEILEFGAFGSFFVVVEMDVDADKACRVEALLSDGEEGPTDETKSSVGSVLFLVRMVCYVVENVGEDFGW